MAVLILCRQIDEDLERYDSTKDPMILDSVTYRLDLLQRHLYHLEQCNVELIESIAMCRGVLFDLEDDPMSQPASLVPLQAVSHGRGRPKLLISQEQLEHLIGYNFSCQSIASMLGVSVRTIYRRMQEFSMSIQATYSNISDSDLDEKVTLLKQDYPNAGYRMISGLLLQEGIRLQQHRVRECMHRVDPLGVATRWGESIRRRVYNVLSPLSLWHLDGNHKLIRYESFPLARTRAPLSNCLGKLARNISLPESCLSKSMCINHFLNHPIHAGFFGILQDLVILIGWCSFVVYMYLFIKY